MRLAVQSEDVRIWCCGCGTLPTRSETCRPVRDLIAAYLREGAPVMDYGSLSNLTHWLAELFWGDVDGIRRGSCRRRS